MSSIDSAGRAEQEAEPLLITGCYRSGTTLVEKILNMHPNVTVASQPFPVLYFLFKERFNQTRGIHRRYPLDHLFGENAYSAKDFSSFLDTYELPAAGLGEFRARMQAYTEGLWTPEILDHLADLEPGTFLELRDQLNRRISWLFSSGTDKYVGGKEVLVEEYAQPLTKRGTRVVIVIRDPRAMIASLNFRELDNLTGELRPVLYSLRAWRKSVALAITAVARGALILRYEDVVRELESTLSRLTDYLDLKAFAENAFDQGIVDQHGRPWGGNSSFTRQHGISRQTLNAWRERLPETVLAFIESVCQPEMNLLGYPLETEAEERQEVLLSYRDPFPVTHREFPANYSGEAERLAAERHRLELLQHGKLDADEQRRWFISSECWYALRSAAE